MKMLKLLNEEIIELSIKTPEGFYKAEIIHVGNEGEPKYLIHVNSEFENEGIKTLPILLTTIRDFIVSSMAKNGEDGI